MGLLISVFLLIAGVTGTVLAFYRELDGLLNPELFESAPPSAAATLLDPVELRDRVQAQFPKEKIDAIVLDRKPGESVNFWVDGREVFVDPYDGHVRGARTFGTLKEGKWSVLTFIYVLHYSLALGEVGNWLFGIAAVLWTFDNFVGAYLTFPPSAAASGKQQRRSWLAWLVRWLRAWQLKSGTLFSLVFTWHRASGLWVWGFLLVFAWSGVALNLGDQVYSPVMNVLLGPAHEEPEEHEPPPEPRDPPQLDAHAALDLGRKLMAAAAEQRGFQILSEKYLSYDPVQRAYAYIADSSLDVDARLAGTMVTFNGDDGRQLELYTPADTTRDTFDSWLIALHFGRIRQLGFLYRSFVGVLGCFVAALSVSGVWIWLRKRRKR